MITKVAINANWGAFRFTPEMLIWLAARGIDIEERQQYELDRHDPLLVECVESCSNVGDIIIVEIDEDRYFIEEYDGMETIYTPGSCPWILV